MSSNLIAALGPTLWDLGTFKSVQNPKTILLVAEVVNGAGESKYSALREPGAAGGYQVTTGKTLYLTKLFLVANANATGWLTLSGTADAGSNQVAAPAGAKSLDTVADGNINPFIAATAQVVGSYDIHAKVPSALYPCVRVTTASAITRFVMLGHEE